MLKTVKKIISLLTSSERKSALFLLTVIIIVALIDMMGVASILPFIAVISNPSLVETNQILNNTYKVSQSFGVENLNEFTLMLGTLMFCALIISLIFKSLLIFLQNRFVHNVEYSIGKRLLKHYLSQPYSWFLNKNSADIANLILSEVSHTVGGGLKPFIDLIAKSLVIVAIILLLVLVDFKLTMIISFLFGFCYLIIFSITNKFLKNKGDERLKSNQLRFKLVSESFGASKEVKVSGLENVYVNNFSKIAKIYAKTQILFQTVSQLPRFVLEAIAFGGIVIILIYLVSINNNFLSVLPILSLFAFAGYRLLPAIQQIYQSIASINYVNPSVGKIFEDFNKFKNISAEKKKDILNFEETIELKDVFFRYLNSSSNVLSKINLKIQSGTFVGFIGTTGSGKTTLIDIILGLLEPHKGTLEIDGKIITKNNLRLWQNNIGYVPQQIYLTDDTIAANIAFGEKPEDIDHEAVKKSSKIANLHEFINNELPKKYETIVGERGIRLSGGQRQRIGIARALYYNPKVLIFDEATSALDNETEKKVMKSIKESRKENTLILIAHRLNTLKDCDVIYHLNKGQIYAKGDYNQIIRNQAKMI